MAAASAEHKSVVATCAALDQTVNQVAATSSGYRLVAATCAALNQTVYQALGIPLPMDQTVYQALGIPLPMDHEEDNQPQRRNLGRHTLLESAEPQRSSTAH